jgi:tRNA-splicing ligase RtcB
VSSHFIDQAKQLRPELQADGLGKLAWLEEGTDEAEAWWTAMKLMGRYASACHEALHRHLLGHFQTSETLFHFRHHHNFAWKERWQGEEYYVHRKGATPAHEGELGIIPGTMTDPAFIVQGKGSSEAINSASHGAGRAMSRTEAKETFDDTDRPDDIRLLSSGVDEIPDVYKDIETVMGHQQDLVEPIATFQPKIVKMADPNQDAPWEQND